MQPAAVVALADRRRLWKWPPASLLGDLAPRNCAKSQSSVRAQTSGVMSNPRVPFQMSSERAKLAPLKGKSIIVHIVVNVEYWPFDQPMPRKVLSTPHGVDRIPDIPNYSWAEYGLRCGMPRLIKLFGKNNLSVSVNINAAVIDVYPSLAKAMRDAGWEFICHGMTQRLLHVEKDEAATIRACISKVGDFVKKKPRGWMGPGFAETFDTPDILKAADIEYVLDWTIDDIPCWMTTKHGPLICMPYGTELNDSLIYAVEQQSSAEVLQRFKDTLATLRSWSWARIQKFSPFRCIRTSPASRTVFPTCMASLIFCAAGMT